MRPRALICGTNDRREARKHAFDGGGEIVAVGTPEDIVREKRSYTGAFLKPVLARGSGRGKPKRRIEAAE
jgi:hypothetical protein